MSASEILLQVHKYLFLRMRSKSVAENGRKCDKMFNIWSPVR